MTRNLPEFPNLDHLKKHAKVLLRRMQGRDPAARLAKAQRALALEYGFASWPRLKAHVESMPRPETAGGGGTTSGTMGPRQEPGGGDRLFPRFTEKARRTIFFARYFSMRANNIIEAEHLLSGLIQADAPLMDRLLPGRFQPQPAPATEEIQRLKALLIERIQQLPERSESPAPISVDCKRILEQAAKEADRLQHQRISTGHFLLGFLSGDGVTAAPMLAGMLTEKGLRLNTARSRVTSWLNEEFPFGEV